MSSERRFIGVARAPQAADPDAPRPVVDLRRTSASSVPRPTAPPIDDATARPRRYAAMAEHRRRLGRMVLRRLEVATWITAIVVVVGVVAFIVVRIPLGVSDVVAGTFVAPSASAAPDASASASPGTANAVCFFEPCGRSDLTGPPTYLRIPSINVKTPLEDLVVDGNQVLQPPKTYEKAGWWTQGVVPGDPGPSVIAGHVDSKRGPAVFYDLKSLRAGDLVEVDRGGQVVTFQVYEVEKYPKNDFPTAKVYKPTPGAELRLITCGGLFDEARLSYRDNIVVYALLRATAPLVFSG